MWFDGCVPALMKTSPRINDHCGVISRSARHGRRLVIRVLALVAREVSRGAPRSPPDRRIARDTTLISWETGKMRRIAISAMAVTLAGLGRPVGAGPATAATTTTTRDDLLHCRKPHGLGQSRRPRWRRPDLSERRPGFRRAQLQPHVARSIVDGLTGRPWLRRLVDVVARSRPSK
jgi:hypothetical protein